MSRVLGSRGGTAGAPAQAAVTGVSPRALLPPLVLAQFLASYDSSSMNVAISRIADDLNTTVTGVQTAITLFTLTMAALMIPGSKLSDIWGRKRLFRLGICVYGTGALITAFSPALAFMIVGWSLLEGIGSALMIPPIYILCTVSFDDKVARTKAFAAVSAAAGLGAASGPLIGGIITTATTWRVSFLCEVVVTLLILFLSRRLIEGPPEAARGSFDIWGAVLSAAGLVFVVLGILQAGNYGWVHARKDFELFGKVILEKGDISPVIVLIAIGLVLLVAFGWWVLRRERKGKAPLVPLHLLRGRVVALGLLTQNVQWFMLIGTSFVVSVFLQVARGYDALQTGVVLIPATVGILLVSTRMGRMTQRFSQRTVIRAGFVVALVGIALILLLNDQDSSVWLFVPGLFFFGAGAGMVPSLPDRRCRPWCCGSGSRPAGVTRHGKAARR
jgi:MFS family permease